MPVGRDAPIAPPPPHVLGDHFPIFPVPYSQLPSLSPRRRGGIGPFTFHCTFHCIFMRLHSRHIRPSPAGQSHRPSIPKRTPAAVVPAGGRDGARPSRRSGGWGGARGGRTRQARPSRRSGGRGGAGRGAGGRDKRVPPGGAAGGARGGRTDGARGGRTRQARPSRRGEDGSRTSCRRGACGRHRPFR